MLCLEVSLNGQRLAVAGIADAESLTASVNVLPGFNECRVEVVGNVDPEGQPPLEAQWLSVPVELGGRVEVRFFESDTPTRAKLHRFDPTVQASDGVPLVCAFCGKDQDAVQGAMIAGRNAVVCHECVRFLGELVTEDVREPTDAP